MTLLLHRLAAVFLRLRGRPPLEEMLSAWAGGRWHMGCYQRPAAAIPTPSAATEAA